MVKSARAILFVLLLLVPAGEVSAEETVPIGNALMNIIPHRGREVQVSAEVTFTSKQLVHGLTFRRDMTDDHGILVILSSPRLARMSIEDTPVPLDMLFIDSYGVIREIKPELTPHSEAVVSSSKAVHYVVELKGGMAARFGLQPGDRVKFPALTRETHPVIKVAP